MGQELTKWGSSDESRSECLPSALDSMTPIACDDSGEVEQEREQEDANNTGICSTQRKYNERRGGFIRE